MDIQNAFASTFFATHLFIATWDAVGYYYYYRPTDKVLKYEWNTVVSNQFCDNNFDYVVYCQINIIIIKYGSRIDQENYSFQKCAQKYSL